MIHVCYGLYDKTGRYSKFTGTSILSMFENTGAKVTVHILHDNTLSADNRQKFLTVAKKYNQRVEFHNVEEICANKIQLLREKLSIYIGTRFSIGAFYRLLIKDISLENIPKIIYLDSDTVVNLDIQELWNTPMENYEIAAVPEIEATRNHMITNKYLLHAGIVNENDYLCSGIVIMNLEEIGVDFFDRGVNWLAENLKCECPDQDILNNFYSTHYVRLLEKFNAFVGVAKDIDNNAVYQKIYHYAGNVLEMDMRNAYNKLFFTYFSKTPWFSVEMIGRFNDSINDFINKNWTAFSIRLTKMMMGKQRAFFLDPAITELAKKFFMIEKTEEIISAKIEDALQTLIKTMKKSKGKKVFFAIVDNYELLKFHLNKAGFVEHKDFDNGTIFMPSLNDQIFRTYQLVKDM